MYPIYGLGRIGSWYALPGDALALDGYQITDGDVDLPAYVPGTTPNYLYQGEDVVTLQQGFEVSWQQATDNMFHVASVAALRDEDSERYELADHLGNVRVTVGREKAVDNTAETIGYTDYYPFGMALPSQRSVGSPKYRYGYQGQFAEYDEDESGLHHFELREYDSRLGRMLIPDPYGQFASPYIAMGNNPANLVDADGGFVGDPIKDFIAAGGTVLDEMVVNGVRSIPTIAQTASSAAGAIAGQRLGRVGADGREFIYSTELLGNYGVPQPERPVYDVNK